LRQGNPAGQQGGVDGLANATIAFLQKIEGRSMAHAVIGTGPTRPGARTEFGRRTWLLGGAGAAALAMRGAGTAHAQAKPPLSVAVGTDATTLDPCRIAGGNDYFFFANVFEGLYGPDEQGKPAPLLAESHTVSPDGLVWDFTLRPNARFHNGEPVTADDVRFSWQRAVAPETRNPRASVLVANIADVVVLDERRCQVRLKKRDASFLDNCGEYWYIISRKHVESAGENPFDRMPIGTGPFAFVERRIRSYIKLRGFEQHWGRVPAFGEVTLKVIPDDQSRVAQVQTGEADIVINIPPVLAAPLQRLPNVQIIRAPSFQNIYMALNALNGHPGLQRADVRRALNMAVDKQALLRATMLGFARQIEMPCQTGIFGCDATVTPYGFDPTRAREILSQAGFDFNRPLRILGQGTGRVPQARETVQGVASFLNRIGVRTEITMLDYGAWISTYGAKEKDPNVDLIFANFTDYNADPSGRLLRQIRSGSVYSWYSNAEIDAQLDRMNDFASTEERRKFVQSIMAKLHEEAPLITLWTVDSVYGAGRGIRWTPTPNVSWPVLFNVQRA
jgi:peptide/nickel transport system substrate-binding protein